MGTRAATRLPRTRAQRGAALLTAMIIVTLIVTLTSAMIWQQWRAVQVEAAERARVQAAWILNGALDWARLILREDARSGRPTALTEPWATPRAEARLSTFLALDTANAEGAPDAFLSGSISDEQALYNLANLVDKGKAVPDEVAALQRLCQTVGVADDVATRIATGLVDSDAPPGANAAAAPLRPETVAQLAWFGIDTESLQRLAPYVTLLPAHTAVNVNTASREVLSAAVEGLDLATAERLIQLRQRDPFKDFNAIKAQLPGITIDSKKINVRSDFFEVRGKLRLDDRVLEQRSLVQRRGLDMVVLHREQVSSRDSGGA